MKYKTMFRLIVQLIAVYLIAVNIAATLGGLMQALMWQYQMTINAQTMGGAGFGAIPGMSMQFWGMMGSPVIGLVVGVILFMRAAWIANIAIPSNRTYCPNCAYEIPSPGVKVCPECGVASPPLTESPIPVSPGGGPS